MEEETDTADTFNEFSERCIELLRQHRKYFPPHNAHAWHKLKFLLKCVSFLYSMNAFKSCFPFRNELHVEVTGNLKRGTLEWMQEIQHRFHRDPQTGGHSIRTLIKFIDLLNIDLQKATSHYCHLFESIVRVNYSALVFKQME
ncbi:BAI1-associated protein 3, partial [Stegodyphus mimosarum]